ncbi:unnamed protein product [Haemonchus placei]|uniref:HTH luxR-type domain-containing protein n=1 Tax=Haemonchus placei TaxID=6290 RepID=A0A0N4W638_HAEPC|nr:unnamed protein product [Haemonchus placei]
MGQFTSSHRKENRNTTTSSVSEVRSTLLIMYASGLTRTRFAVMLSFSPIALRFRA